MLSNNNLNSIVLTDEQQRSINFNSGDLLIKGVPGSGKSVVVMKRALSLAQRKTAANMMAKVAIFTFANSLVKYTNEVIDIVQPQNTIVIKTMDSYCLSLVREMTGQRYIDMVKDRDRIDYVTSAMQECREQMGKAHRFFEEAPSFWAEEFLWIKQKNIKSLEEYVYSERKGRGSKIRITKEDRPVVYAMFSLYEKIMKTNNKHDWEDLYTYLIENEADIPYKAKFDYVLIDEAQDFSYAKLYVAKLLAKESITIAADVAQKIYKTTFTWRELGIDIRGNSSKTLEKTFRSTKQIVAMADRLKQANIESGLDSGDFTETVLPSAEGPIPMIINCKNIGEENEIILSLIEETEKRNETIGILFRTRSDINQFEARLRASGKQYQKISSGGEWSLMEPGVKLVTLHSSKGLEFDTVVIPHFSEGIFPLQSEIEGADNEQKNEVVCNERVLLYVGMTRARKSLYLLFTPPFSPFIYDFSHPTYDYLTAQGTLLEKPVVPEPPIVAVENEEKTETEKQEIKTVKVGSLIQHPVFGKGTVLKIKRNGNMEVDFETNGKIKISPKTIPITIIG